MNARRPVGRDDTKAALINTRSVRLILKYKLYLYITYARAFVPKAQIYESKSAQKDLARAPKEILLAYEVWARRLGEHGQIILREFKGYHDENYRVSG